MNIRITSRQSIIDQLPEFRTNWEHMLLNFINKNPEGYIQILESKQASRQRAIKNPELINLLREHSEAYDISISAIVSAICAELFKHN